MLVRKVKADTLWRLNTSARSDQSLRARKLAGHQMRNKGPGVGALALLLPLSAGVHALGGPRVEPRAVRDIGIMHAPAAPSTAGSLVLEVTSACQGDFGDTVEVEVWMRYLTQSVTGFQAFLQYDDALLSYRGDLSAYTLSPFSIHIQNVETAEISPGQLNLDGSDFSGAGTGFDALLATLVFDVFGECNATSVSFRDATPFASELSYQGNLVPTDVTPTSLFVLDGTFPTVTAGTVDGTYAYRVWAEAAAIAATTTSDNCTGPEELQSEAATSGECPATVTVTVADECANSDSVTYDTCIDTEGDEDGDGVLNGADECPETAPGAPVHADGCSCAQRANRLNIEPVEGETCFREGSIMCVEFSMTCLEQLVSGFQAFLGYDNAVLQYRGDLSAYTPIPFPVHFQSIELAEVTPGSINLDGSIALPDGNPPGEDALLATLCFEVLSGTMQMSTSIQFRDASPFISKLSFQGKPIQTFLSGSPTVMIGLRRVTATVGLAGVVGPLTRCIRFTPKNGAACAPPVDVEVVFTGTPAARTVTLDVECGNWTDLCAKDEQHTLGETVGLLPSGEVFLGESELSLRGGDTNNDDLIDIDDVTFLIATYGMAAATGGCPWDETRDADYNNNGAADTEDYTFLVASWLGGGSCVCTLNEASSAESEAQQLHDTRSSVLVTQLRDDPARNADLNEYGTVDYRDVEVLERQYGLSDGLFTKVRATSEPPPTERVNKPPKAR